MSSLFIHFFQLFTHLKSTTYDPAPNIFLQGVTNLLNIIVIYGRLQTYTYTQGEYYVKIRI